MGLQQGRWYEACVSVRNSQGWGRDSPPSQSACIGVPVPFSRPSAAAAPCVTTPRRGVLRVSWTLADAVPEVERSLVCLQRRGSSSWCLVAGGGGGSGRRLLVDEATKAEEHRNSCALPTPSHTVEVVDLDTSCEYRATVALANSQGWGETSEPSAFTSTAGRSTENDISESAPVERPSSERGHWLLEGLGSSAAVCACCVLRRDAGEAVVAASTAGPPRRKPSTGRLSGVPQQQPQASSSKCVACSEAIATMAIVPCGHKCLCEPCLARGGGHLSLCPICRCKIQSILRIYG